MTQWHVCFKCDEIGHYAIDEEDSSTTFPRGVFLVHRGFLITGISSKKEAQDLLEKDPYKMKPKAEGK